MKYSGITIYSDRDEFGLVEVVDDIATRKMYFDSPIEQSCIFLNAPMTLNFEYQEKIIQQLIRFSEQQKKHKPLRALMLGMGGGSMAHHLYHTIPNLQMTVVELRQIVIDCAYRFFQLPDVPEIETLEDDAIQFIADNTHNYDVIIVDIFDAQGLPSALSNSEFHENIRQSINSPGLVIFNLWHKWNEQQNSKKLIPTEETQEVVNFWQDFTNDNTGYVLNRYNIQSSQNLILEVLNLDKKT